MIYQSIFNIDTGAPVVTQPARINWIRDVSVINNGSSLLPHSSKSIME